MDGRLDETHEWHNNKIKNAKSRAKKNKEKILIVDYCSNPYTQFSQKNVQKNRTHNKYVAGKTLSYIYKYNKFKNIIFFFVIDYDN